MIALHRSARYWMLFLILALLIFLLSVSMAYAQISTLTFTLVADAPVNRPYPYNNYGSCTSLSVDGSPVIRSYLRFDVRGLNGAKVSSAKLRFYVVDDSSSGFSVAGISNSSWSESTITYNTAPTLGNTIKSIGGYGANRWIEIDITCAVTGEGQVTFAMHTTKDTSTSVASRETGANAPQLVLALGASAPTVSAQPQPQPALAANASLFTPGVMKEDACILKMGGVAGHQGAVMLSCGCG